MIAVTGRSLLAPASSNEWQLYKLSVDGFAGHFHLNALARNAFAGNQHIAEALAKTLLDQDPDPPQGTGLGAIGNDFWLERRFVPPSEEPDRGVGFCFGLVFGVRAQASGVSPFGSTVGGAPG